MAQRSAALPPGAKATRPLITVLIELRDRTCQFPGCDRPASECQIDHITEWQRGGPTTQTNGRLLCPTHNRQRPGNPSPSGNPGPDQGGPRSNQNTGHRTRGSHTEDPDDGDRPQQ